MLNSKGIPLVVLQTSLASQSVVYSKFIRYTEKVSLGLCVSTESHLRPNLSGPITAREAGVCNASFSISNLVQATCPGIGLVSSSQTGQKNVLLYVFIFSKMEAKLRNIRKETGLVFCGFIFSRAKKKSSLTNLRKSN